MRKIHNLFIGSSTAYIETAKLIADLFDSNPVIHVFRWWDKSLWPSGHSYFESLMDFVDRCDLGLFIASPDDIIIQRDSEKIVPRDNVVFEFGLFVGKNGRSKSILLQVDQLDFLTDLKGISIIKIDSQKLNDPDEINRVYNLCIDIF